MHYRRTKAGYYYREYSNGRSVRISKDEYLKVKNLKGGRRKKYHKKRKSKKNLTIKQFITHRTEGWDDISLYFGSAWDNFYILNTHSSEPRKATTIQLRENEFVIMNCIPGCTTYWSYEFWSYLFNFKGLTKEQLFHAIMDHYATLWCLYKPSELVPNLNVSAWSKKKTERWGLYKVPIEYEFSKKRKKSFYRTFLKRKPKTLDVEESDLYRNRPYIRVTSNHVRYPYGKYVTLKSIIKGLRKRYKKKGFILFMSGCRNLSSLKG